MPRGSGGSRPAASKPFAIRSAPVAGAAALPPGVIGLAGALVLGNEFPPTGALWAIKNGARSVMSDTLTAPGGVAVDNDGHIFVTTLTFGPPGGSVISLNG